LRPGRVFERLAEQIRAIGYLDARIPQDFEGGPNDVELESIFLR
jgi:hypothetical protein